MISEKHKCIFVHIRKNAGSSVHHMFEAVGDEHAANDKRLTDGVLDVNWKTTDLENYFKFAVVRNPWDRFVSGWKYLATTRNRNVKDVLRNMPQEEILRGAFTRNSSPKAFAYYLRHFIKEKTDGTREFAPGHEYRHITRPQFMQILDDEEQIVVDRVVFFEDFERGMLEVFNELGVEAPISKHINAGRHRRTDFRKYFDADSRKMIAQMFEKDIEMWGYDFDTDLPRALK